MLDPAKLRQWLSTYQNPDKTYRDISQAMNHYPGLVPQQETYTFVSGVKKDLVNLSGTIPVTYRGSKYNIPICIWLMDTHAKHAPICYVQPTADMSIKISIFVDQNGKIYLPYLHDWTENKSDLVGLIQIMIVTFGDQPPVFAKPKTDSNPPYPSSMPFMPSTPMFGGGTSSYSGNPPYPPTNVYPGNSYPSNMPSYPPYPASNNAFSNFPAYPNTPFPVFPPGGNVKPLPSMVSEGGGTIKDEHIRESLLTAVEEKLVRRMKEQFLQNQAELQTLQRTQEELKQGKTKLDGLLSKLEKEQKDLEKNITLLKDKEQELNTAIEKIGSQESIDVDDAVTATAPLYKQLLNAFAEEAAHEDAIYYMGEALRCGVIDLDVFLRQVRSLSRKQFMLRALMQKCRQRAGLPIA